MYRIIKQTVINQDLVIKVFFDKLEAVATYLLYVLVYKYMHKSSGISSNRILGRDKYRKVNSFFFLNVFMHLFLVVLGLCFCMGFSLVAMSRSYSLLAVLGFLIAVVSLVAGHKLWRVQASVAVSHRLSSCRLQGTGSIVALQHVETSCARDSSQVS